MRRRAVAIVVLLVGCATLPAGLARLSSGQVPVGELRAAWEAAGREWPADAPGLDRVHVYVAPADEIERWCFGPARSCMTTGRDMFESPRVNVYIDAQHDERTRDRLLIHELGHYVRGRWVLERRSEPDYLERYRAGRVDPECNPRTMQDHAHCDVELWTTIERDAIRRWEAR